MTAAPPADPLASIAAARAAISETAERVRTVEEAADEANRRRKGRDRSMISTVVILTYAVAILGAFVYILAVDPDCSGADAATCTALTAAWEKKTDVLLNLITTAVLPIVTLMLGFYFGTERAAAGREEDGQ